MEFNYCHAVLADLYQNVTHRCEFVLRTVQMWPGILVALPPSVTVVQRGTYGPILVVLSVHVGLSIELKRRFVVKQNGFGFNYTYSPHILLR